MITPKSFAWFQSTPSIKRAICYCSKDSPHQNCFNPRPKYRGDIINQRIRFWFQLFQPTPPNIGGDQQNVLNLSVRFSFNPRLTWKRLDITPQSVQSRLFQSTPQYWGNVHPVIIANFSFAFQSTPPIRERHSGRIHRGHTFPGFNPRPNIGATPKTLIRNFWLTFQSTPPYRRRLDIR